VIHGDGRRVAPSSMGLRVIGAKINKANARHLVAYLYPQTTTWCTVHAHGALGVEAARIQHVDEHLIPGYHRQRVRFGGSRLVHSSCHAAPLQHWTVPRTAEEAPHATAATAQHCRFRPAVGDHGGYSGWTDGRELLEQTLLRAHVYWRGVTINSSVGWPSGKIYEDARTLGSIASVMVMGVE
jgi:hypothetical protein